MSYHLQGIGAALGAIAFNASSVWADWQAGAAGNKPAGGRAARAVQAGLNEIGYGPISVDGIFGAGSLAAWKKFGQANGVPASWPTKEGILKLGEQLAKGGNQGGGGIVESHIVGDTYVPGPAPGGGSSQAGMSSGTMIGIGVAALVIVGGLAVMSKKKGQSAHAR